jgi:nucleotide-binding universal stress UspA family protein
MFRSLLIGLDGSPDGESALELGIRWAKRSDALLVGMGVLDEPGIHGAEELLVGESYFHSLNVGLLSETRKHVEQALARAALRCSEAGVTFKELEDVGVPYARIAQQAPRYDLVLLGQRTHFQFGYREAPDDTLAKVLAECPRPVVAVPTPLVADGPVVVAYDASLQADRTLASFRASGLARGREVHVVSVAPEPKAAALWADRAVEYLRPHGVEARPHPQASDCPPAEIILGWARRHAAALLVMGAYGQPVLREFFLGSVTRTILKESTIPVFLDH